MDRDQPAADETVTGSEALEESDVEDHAMHVHGVATRAHAQGPEDGIAARATVREDEGSDVEGHAMHVHGVATRAHAQGPDDAFAVQAAAREDEPGI